jgi:hypothetical protein
VLTVLIPDAHNVIWQTTIDFEDLLMINVT